MKTGESGVKALTQIVSSEYNFKSPPLPSSADRDNISVWINIEFKSIYYIKTSVVNILL